MLKTATASRFAMRVARAQFPSGGALAFSITRGITFWRIGARPGERAGNFCRALAVAPPTLPPERAKLMGGMDPGETLGSITVGPAATTEPGAARSPSKDEDKHDKAGDEPCQHPQQKPLVRFHRFPKEVGLRARRTLLREADG